MLCFNEDEYSQSFAEGNPRWVVTLNNGQTVYQDDGRPGVSPHSAWIRLKEYCNKNKLYITNFSFGFRSNKKTLEPNADGYYFCKGSRGAFGASKTLQLFFIGTLINNVLSVSCWKVPEMIREKTEIRNHNEANECLIRKNTNQFMEQKTY